MAFLHLVPKVTLPLNLGLYGQNPMKQPVIWIDGSSEAASSYETWSDVPSFFIQEDEHLRDAFERTAQMTDPLVVIQGDDAFVARVLTMAQRHKALAASLFFLPLDLGTGFCVVANTLGIPADSKKAAKQCYKAIRQSRLKRHYLPMMRWTSSSEPSARFVFQVGLGDMVPLLARRASDPFGGVLTLVSGMVQPLAQSEEKHVARMTIDHQPVVMRGFMIASALERSWFDLDMSSHSLAYRQGESIAELAQSIVKSQVPLAKLRSDDKVQSFQTITWDGCMPCVVDGQPYQPTSDEVCVLSGGPNAPLIAW